MQRAPGQRLIQEGLVSVVRQGNVVVKRLLSLRRRNQIVLALLLMLDVQVHLLFVQMS